MKRLTNDIEYILFALQNSSVVEVRVSIWKMTYYFDMYFKFYYNFLKTNLRNAI